MFCSVVSSQIVVAVGTIVMVGRMSCCCGGLWYFEVIISRTIVVNVNAKINVLGDFRRRNVIMDF